MMGVHSKVLFIVYTQKNSALTLTIMESIQSYISKQDYIYNILKCPNTLSIPINDFQVWKSRDSNIQTHLWVYNKLEIARSQDLECGPLGVYPDKYPVLVKPITNLYGMGKDAQIVHTLYEFRKICREKSGLFWTRFLTGKHYSVDIACKNGVPLWNCCFRGENGKTLGTFDYWETIPDYRLPACVKEWMRKNFSKYVGWMNIELIGDKVIECHLRIGDVNQVCVYNKLVHPKSSIIFPSIIDFYKSKSGKWTLPESYKVPKIFLIPVFVDEKTYYANSHTKTFTKPNIYRIASNYKDKGVFMLQKDPPPEKCSHPVGSIRVCNISCDNLSQGMKLKKEILGTNRNLEFSTSHFSKYIVITIVIVVIVSSIVLYLLFAKK
jgi:hypothetical protein